MQFLGKFSEWFENKMAKVKNSKILEILEYASQNPREKNVHFIAIKDKIPRSHSARFVIQKF